jgi:hypothetical protein
VHVAGWSGQQQQATALLAPAIIKQAGGVCSQVEFGWVHNTRSSATYRVEQADQWDWCPGEPNNAGAGEDSAVIVRNCTGAMSRGGLIDIPGSSYGPTICSKLNSCTGEGAWCAFLLCVACSESRLLFLQVESWQLWPNPNQPIQLQRDLFPCNVWRSGCPVSARHMRGKQASGGAYQRV